ncbi:MAG: ATP-binding cassette domain-containing protein, partial [Bacteroidetes bacterium]
CWYRASSRCWLPPQARSVGYVFQDYGLFPHMSIWENLCFALPKGDGPTRVADLLEMVGLSELRNRRPGRLSGGQKQRVALVRAFIRRPRLLLLDEPLAAQDQKLRTQLQADLQQLHAHLRVPGILVSHDKGEIMRLASRVIRLEPGGAVQSGTPGAILAPPQPVRVEVLAYQAGKALVLAGGQPLWVPVAAPVAPGDWITLAGMREG